MCDLPGVVGAAPHRDPLLGQAPGHVSGSRPVTVNQRVGASPGRRSPSTATPSIGAGRRRACRPAPAPPPTGAGRPRSSMNRRGLRPASCSNGRVPSSRRSGTVSGEGDELVRVQSGQQGRLGAQHPEMRARTTCRRSRRPRRRPSLADRCAGGGWRRRRRRRSVPRRARVRADGGDVGRRPDDVRCGGEGHPPGASDSDRGDVLRLESQRGPVELGEAHRGPGPLAAITQGRTLPSWSSRVTTTSSPGRGSGPRRPRTASSARSSTRRTRPCPARRRAARRTPRAPTTPARRWPRLWEGTVRVRVSPDRHHAVAASIACRRPGARPARRAEPSHPEPGKRSTSTPPRVRHPAAGKNAIPDPTLTEPPIRQRTTATCAAPSCAGPASTTRSPGAPRRLARPSTRPTPTRRAGGPAARRGPAFCAGFGLDWSTAGGGEGSRRTGCGTRSPTSR